MEFKLNFPKTDAVLPTKVCEEPPKKRRNVPIRLNVGGTIFTTLKETLLNAGHCYFTGLFDERYEEPARDPIDDSIYIDRDPIVFRTILNYLRTLEFRAEDFNNAQLNLLEVEARYYGLSSMVACILRNTFLTRAPLVAVCEGRRVKGPEVACVDNFNAISSKPFSDKIRVMKVRVIDPGRAFIGVAAKTYVEKGGKWNTTGWHFLLNGGGKFHKGLIDMSGRVTYEPFIKSVVAGSEVWVSLTSDGDIKVRINDGEWSVMYSNIPNDTPLHLAVTLGYSKAGGVLTQGGAIEFID